MLKPVEGVAGSGGFYGDRSQVSFFKAVGDQVAKVPGGRGAVAMEMLFVLGTPNKCDPWGAKQCRSCIFLYSNQVTKVSTGVRNVVMYSFPAHHLAGTCAKAKSELLK